MTTCANPFPRFGGEAPEEHAHAIAERLEALGRSLRITHSCIDTDKGLFQADIGAVSVLLGASCPVRDIRGYVDRFLANGSKQITAQTANDKGPLRIDASVLMPLRHAGVTAADLRDALEVLRRRPRVMVNCFSIVHGSTCAVHIDGLKLYRQGSTIYALYRNSDVTISGRTITIMKPYVAPATVLSAIAGERLADVVSGVFPDDDDAVITKAWCAGKGEGSRLSLVIGGRSIDDDDAITALAA